MKQEIVKIKKREAICDGGNDNEGHPKISLTIANNKKDVTCPYCSKLFVYSK